MGSKGWIKIHRQIQDSEIWNCEKFSKGQAWIDLLLSANHENKTVNFGKNEVVIERGQLLTSQLKLANKWGWNRKTVAVYLSALQTDKMITYITDNKKTLITVENYGFFQDDLILTDNRLVNSTDNKTVSNTVNKTDNRTDNKTDTNKKYKEDKEEQEEKKIKKKSRLSLDNLLKEKFFPNDELLNQAFDDFVKMRKQIKKPMTDRAVQMAIKELNNLATVDDVFDNDLALKIINQSIYYSWQSFYPLKDNGSNNKSFNKPSSNLSDWDNA